jgi:hypothetical protein
VGRLAGGAESHDWPGVSVTSDPSDWPGRSTLQEMRGLLDGSARALRHVQMEHKHAALAGSIARGEIDSEQRVLDAYSAAGLNIGVAADHLDGISKVLDPADPQVFAPPSLARQALETSARGWWLLDPGLGLAERISRGFTERIFSVRDSLKLTVLPEEARRKVSRSIARIETDIVRLRLQPVRNKKGGLIAVGKSRPSASELVHQLLPSGIGGSVYRDLSAASHGTLYGVISRLRAEPDPNQPGLHRGFLEVSIGPIVMLIGATLWGFLDAADRQVEIHGWDDTHWRAWRTHALSKVGTHLSRLQGGASTPHN